VKIVVGLGNPGAPYEGSRHNIGFMVVDRLAAEHHILISTKRFRSVLGRGRIGPQEVLLVKPMTFMNLSGEAVQRVLHFFHSGPENLIVIHDDMDLSLGRLRFKLRGGDGGHLGVRSILEALQGHTFLRLKVGIGRPHRGMDPSTYVLSRFDPLEQPNLIQTVHQAAAAIEVAISDGVQKAMNQFQKKLE